VAPDRKIPVAKPWMGEAEAEAARRAILSGWITQGPEVAALEQEFAAWVGAPHACAVSSCTAALHLALVAVGVGAGDEVVTVSHSFIATANAVLHVGARPVFVDISPESLNIDAGQVEAAITARTRAILCVHQVGLPCDLGALTALARQHGLSLIEDAACALGSEILWADRWERIGRPHGDVACFSLHPRKLITTGDGGLLTTARPELDAAFRLLRHQGMTISDAERHASRSVLFEEYASVGFNYRLTDIQAAIGRVQLARLPDILSKRRAQAARYDDLLADVDDVSTFSGPAWARSNWQSYCVRLQPHLDQRTIMSHLLADGIATRRGVMCAHREPAYDAATWLCAARRACDCQARTCRCLQESEQAQDQVIVLPLYHEMTDADQVRVAASLRRACRAVARSEDASRPESRPSE
jgi:dTDP-4-amino-4,6-dideoxygalactose transaminase